MLRPKSHPVKSEGRSISGSSSIGEAPGEGEGWAGGAEKRVSGRNRGWRERGGG